MSSFDELDTTPERSALMARVRQKGTAPEMAVRRLVHGFGYRYTTDNRDLPGSPDLANRKRKWAIFVHGCYWHAHEGCDRHTIPRRNRDYWVEKFRRNKERDEHVLEQLQHRGFTVLVIWECKISDDPEEVKQTKIPRLSACY